MGVSLGGVSLLAALAHLKLLCDDDSYGYLFWAPLVSRDALRASPRAKELSTDAIVLAPAAGG